MKHRILITVLAAGAILAACGDDPPTVSESPAVLETSPAATATASPPPAETSASPAEAAGERVEITVEGGQVRGPGTVTLDAGTEVTLAVTSDTADHIHVHGYDLVQDIAAGETAELTFTADIPGVFEVELEDSATHLVELQVQG